MEHARAAYEQLEAALASRPKAVCIDLSEVGDMDTAGVAAITVGRRLLQRAGAEVELSGVRPHHREMLDDVPPLAAPLPPPERRGWLLEPLGAAVLAAFASVVEFAEMTVDAARFGLAALIGRRTFSRGATVDQMAFIGIDALPIIAMLSFLLGTVLAFQTWVQLTDFGADEYTSHMVGIGMTREFGPFIVAIILAGRSGSAIAAELATMEMREENDALRVLGISPVAHLVVPRMVAITLVTPGLTMVASAVGIFGGIFVTGALGVPWMAATESMVIAMSLDDVWLGLVKSVLFAWAVGLVSCHTGLHSGRDARSVGAAATRAVVTGIFFIIVIDSAVTTAWTMGPHE